MGHASGNAPLSWTLSVTNQEIKSRVFNMQSGLLKEFAAQNDACSKVIATLNEAIREENRFAGHEHPFTTKAVSLHEYIIRPSVITESRRALL